ncbi:aldo/keto reductase [Prolixibacter denitrificans]|uniref:Aryl-alcohol dehydrogenase-like predicted oxidoreductase n=1 Tax=Prolixibacter denitrificans TaxID=1541063 RepID=A0A2P8CFG2_9BACT|nr:aldo/keto reductase [Prolixibacter denitrificans]PSK83686.1 aryl-alcohol dehydrogenase-like predicted oxidoreductase [Prolixibacter denitrificans]GET23231.1 NADP-dependent aryl-alcohol dehydrogenase [Prolixibacter denitrificans]
MIKLGNTDLQTAPIVFGGNVFGWTLDEKESFRILDEFVDAGFNTIDTANVYSRWVDGNQGGESEAIIGKWMKEKGNRDKVTVITKVGSDMGQGHRDLSEKHIMEAVEDSLRRLQTDTIDLYLTHWDDENTPVEETLGAYEKLIKAGKVRFIGASNLPPERLKESMRASAENNLPRYEVFQPEYNLYDRRGFEEGVDPVCREEGLGVITYFSLAKGFLSGKYRSKNDLRKSVRGGGVEGYLNERGFRILKALDELAAKHEVSQAAVALAWLIHQEDVTAPIASATKSSHLKAFFEAVQMKPEPEDLQLLQSASAYK